MHLKVILSGLILLPGLLFGQVKDDFSDGDFSNSPTWSGDDTSFIVVNVFGNERLRSSSRVASSNFYLTTASSLAVNAQWEFYVNLAFNTSSANFVDVYLTSDSANLRAANNNAYYVKIGNTADEISLYKKEAGIITEIIDGVDGVTNSSNTVLKIRVTRDSTHHWMLERDITGSGNNYFIEGTVIDTSIKTSSFFGIHIFQSTASFFQKHFFDDFYVETIIGDTSPPVMVSVNVVSQNALDVSFNEALDFSSAQNIFNYFVDNGIGNPISALRDTGDLSIVHLTFANQFQNGITNTLAVTNISDTSGNILASDSLYFTFFIPDVPLRGDVVINEIFPDPDPPVGLPAAEFIEIYNRSNKTFELSGWTLSDPGGPGTLGSKVFTPGEFLILCATTNAAVFAAFGNVLGVSSFPSLNNSGDEIFLRDSNGNIIDNVNYFDSWYNDVVKKTGGWTLERINPDFLCNDNRNWVASVDSAGGTPGKLNSVHGNFSDTTAPQIVSVQIISAYSLKIIFDEAVDSASVVAVGNYFVNNGIGNAIAALSNQQFTEVTLVLSSFLQTGITYTLTINGISDCSGNSIVNATATFALPELVEKFDVLITEIFADPDPQVALPNAEFLELYNRSEKIISVSGWTISDAATTAAIPASVLLPGEYVIISPASAALLFNPFGKTIAMDLPSLNNDADELSLRNETGELIHQVSYTSDWYRDAIKKNGGWSLEMIDPDNPCTGAGNWRASNDVSGGTPGKINSVNGENRDETAPALLFAFVQDSAHLLLIFDETVDEFTAKEFLNYSIDQGISVTDVVIANTAGTKILLTLSPPVMRNFIYAITLNHISDCVGNFIGVENFAQFGIPEKPRERDLVINEILSNPESGGSDFVEIYNRSQNVIDLKDVIIGKIDADDGDTSSTIVAPGSFQILPKTYVALTENHANILSRYFTPNPKYVIAVQDFPSYADDEDVVVLFNRLDNNSVIDRVHYFYDWHFPLIDDENGVSLEKISYEGQSQDASNWHSAASTVGYATPAYQNSQFGGATASNSTITIDPKTFSPNNDGYNDFVKIIYTLDKPGSVANISIYDSNGRRVKRLAENYLLEVSGSITWDGIDDDNEKARLGVYIIVAELFDLSGRVEKFKESCVLAGKL